MILLAVSLSAKDKAFSVSYTKYQADLSPEIAKVFYDEYLGMYLLIQEPVLQYVNMNPETFIYYYPKDNMAMIMNNRDGVLASAAIQLFLNTASEDMGIAGLGFSLNEHFFRGDTLVKVWELKGKKKNEYIRIEVFNTNKSVVKTLSFDYENKLIKSVLFEDWVNQHNYAYPMKIVINDADVSNSYVFSDLEIIESIPDSILNMFILPEDCEIHEYTW
jgi:hypothetical protein